MNIPSVRISPAGTVESLCFGKEEFILSGCDPGLFRIRLRDIIGNPLDLVPADFQKVEVTVSGNITKIRFKNCIPLPGTGVTAEVAALPDKAEWRICVTPGMADFRPEWADYPRLVLQKHQETQILLPHAEGTLLDDLNVREDQCSFKCKYADYPRECVLNFYPGSAAMQFEAVYHQAGGLFILCADPGHAPKVVDMMPEGKDGIRLVLQQFTGGGNAPDYPVVTQFFTGGWQDAAELYRSWMETNDPCLPAKLAGRMPEWLRNAPVVLAYPIKGAGFDQGSLSTNEYYPYRNILPVMKKYHELWQNPVMALLMHWEGTAPWAPPFVWPPYGGEAEMKDLIDTAHANGDTVGVYCSGTGWTQHSMIDPEYRLDERFRQDHVEREISRGPHGEAWSAVCNGPRGQRLGYDLCPDRKYTRDIVAHEIACAAAAGMDYMQYFDQNQGGASPVCYAKDHGHPDLPGKWLTDSMRELYRTAHQAAGETILGCENAAAEPYMEHCMFNDLRNHLAWGAGGRPVALYSYLFHEYCTGFSGNGVCTDAWIDLEKTPFYLQWLMAWNFVSGNVLSVVLKDHGLIHWSWVCSWQSPAPEQEPLQKLIAELCRWRQGEAKEFLAAGRMEKCPPVECAMRTIHLHQRTPVQVPAVEHACWRGKNGKRVMILVNYNAVPEPCRTDFGSTVIRHDGKSALPPDGIVTLLPYSALLIRE